MQGEIKARFDLLAIVTEICVTNSGYFSDELLGTLNFYSLPFKCKKSFESFWKFGSIFGKISKYLFTFQKKFGENNAKYFINVLLENSPRRKLNVQALFERLSPTHTRARSQAQKSMYVQLTPCVGGRGGVCVISIQVLLAPKGK